MLKKIVSILSLLVQIALAENENRYENPEKVRALEHVIQNSAFVKHSTGIIPVDYSIFRHIGFDYKLLGNLSHDINHTKLVVTEPRKKSYVARDDKRVIYVDSAQENIKPNQAEVGYLINMETDNIYIGVNFKALPTNNNTSYSADIYVMPESKFKRLIFKFALRYIPALDRQVEREIRGLNKTTEDLFRQLRKDPNQIYDTTLEIEEKRRVRELFN